MNQDNEVIICFNKVADAIIAEQYLLEEKIYVKVMPIPPLIRNGCGFCLRFLQEEVNDAVLLLSKRGINLYKIYKPEAGTWVENAAKQ